MVEAWTNEEESTFKEVCEIKLAWIEERNALIKKLRRLEIKVAERNIVIEDLTDQLNKIKLVSDDLDAIIDYCKNKHSNIN